MKKQIPLFVILSLLIASQPAFAQHISTLWGVTQKGGTDDFGSLYHYKPSSANYTLDHNFPAINPGTNPSEDLIDAGNGKFYGITMLGGAYGVGTIFEWDPVTNVHSKKIDMEASEGSRPSGSLTKFGSKYYGMTIDGGSNNYGVIFEWDDIGKRSTNR